MVPLKLSPFILLVLLGVATSACKKSAHHQPPTDAQTEDAQEPATPDSAPSPMAGLASLPQAIDLPMSLAKTSDGMKQAAMTWVESEQTGTLEVGLAWRAYDAALDGAGFALDRAEESTVTIPKLNPACRVSVVGTLKPGPEASSQSWLRIEWRGEACKTDLDSARYWDTLRIVFSKVPSLNGQRLYPQVSVSIQDRLLSECGGNGPLRERLDDCRAVNGAFAKFVAPASEAEAPHSWYLIRFTEKNEPYWVDDQTGLVWGPPLPGLYSATEAADECARQDYLHALPTRDQFQQALKDGLFEVDGASDHFTLDYYFKNRAEERGDSFHKFLVRCVGR